MSIRTIHLLCTDTDREELRALWSQLSAEKVRLARTDRKLSVRDTVLAVLSAPFYRDHAKMDILYELLRSGSQRVLLLRKDEAPIPEMLQNAIRSRTVIPAAGRETAQLTEQLLDEMPPRSALLPTLLVLAGLLLAGGAAFFLWRSQSPEVPEESTVPEETQAPVPLPSWLELKEEDLENVTDLYIVGEYFGYTLKGGESADTVYMSWEGRTPHWYSRTDGREYHMTHYEDLRFISRMTGLRSLLLALVDVDSDRLPDLAGSPAAFDLRISDTTISSLDWLKDSGLTGIRYDRSQVTDFSPLSSCLALSSATLDLYQRTQVKLSAFAPPSLTQLTLTGGGDLKGILDLSGLSACTGLRQVRIEEGMPLTSLSCLSGSRGLETLTLIGLPELTDISALTHAASLRQLTVESCGKLKDYRPLAGCVSLESLRILCDEDPDALTDASFLWDLPHLTTLSLSHCNLRNLLFLEGLADNDPESRFRLELSGDILDYYGLSYVKAFETLDITARYPSDPRGGDYGAILPYLSEAQVEQLTLRSCRGVVLSELPDGVRSLRILGGDLRDLSGLKEYPLEFLELSGCHYLSSLNGLENLSGFFRADSGTEPAPAGAEDPGTAQGTESGGPALPELILSDCPRLTDYSALSGAKLGSLTLSGLYIFPETVSFRCGQLVLEDLPAWEDLARKLLEDGVIEGYEMSGSDTGAAPEGEIQLLSLEDLNTLPEVLLARVERIWIVGDCVFDPAVYEYVPDRKHLDSRGHPTFFLRDRVTREEIPVGTGNIRNLNAFLKLPALKELCLIGQPLQNLQGIQNLTGLVHFEAAYCPDLWDVSAVYNLKGLRDLSLRHTDLGTLNGIQNMTALSTLDIAETKVRYLTPLMSLPNLHFVILSNNMEGTARSIGGQNYRFEIEMEGPDDENK